MNVRLFNTSKCQMEIDGEVRDLNLLDQIAYAARVSNPSNQGNIGTSYKLIDYLIRHKHWSPFEMVNATLIIDTTRDIARQILRHRSFSFQEFSQRYADPTSDLAFEIRDARLQDHKNRQNSIKTDDPELQAWWDAQQKFIVDQAKAKYAEAVERGIAKEQARSVLPEGNTKSRLFMQGNMRSWIHYIELRTTPGTQLEHMEVAAACADALKPEFPMIKDFVVFRQEQNFVGVN